MEEDHLQEPGVDSDTNLAESDWIDRPPRRKPLAALLDATANAFGETRSTTQTLCEHGVGIDVLPGERFFREIGVAHG